MKTSLLFLFFLLSLDLFSEKAATKEYKNVMVRHLCRSFECKNDKELKKSCPKGKMSFQDPGCKPNEDCSLRYFWDCPTQLESAPEEQKIW